VPFVCARGRRAISTEDIHLTPSSHRDDGRASSSVRARAACGWNAERAVCAQPGICPDRLGMSLGSKLASGLVMLVRVAALLLEWRRRGETGGGGEPATKTA
jgi:hypothetical protein